VSKIAFVIPTAYTRPEYLPLAIDSIISQKTSHEIKVLIGCPQSKLEQVRAVLPAGVELVAEDPSGGLASKLHKLLLQALEGCDFVAWLGDDDLLTPGSVHAAIGALEQNPTAAMVYGGCDYIDSAGHKMFTNASGPWAAKILSFGPQLIPQPGSIMRSSAYLESGGLSGEFNLAFDFDLFLRLSKVGPIIFTNQVLAQFRWHPTSLSVIKRMTSVTEASRVRRKHYGPAMKLLWPLWEPWVILATWLAGKLVNFRFR
jgi:GT2 family glycosyltransferase